MNNPRTIGWDERSRAVCLIDQTCLPGRLNCISVKTVERLAAAIKRLEVRGAPALGVAGGYGVALAAINTTTREMPAFFSEVRAQVETLRTVRPTAVNLSWGIDRVLGAMSPASSAEEARELALAEAERIAAEDAAICRRIGANGATLLPSRCTVLTHCNAGALACTEWGTALGVIRSAVAEGKDVKVIASETRPLLQGARLTAWELARDDIPVTVIPDSAAAYLMRKGRIDLVIVGADRITRDMVFNKIGTYMHAVIAQHHETPFYVAAPVSTFDPWHTGSGITIEVRGREEIAGSEECTVVPHTVPVLNYAFDATPIELVTAVITESGVHRTGPELEKIFMEAGTVHRTPGQP
jgi:methylthioribose-1-phosphate isomerase